MVWSIESHEEDFTLTFDKYKMCFGVIDDTSRFTRRYKIIPTRKQLEELYEEIKCVLGESNGS